MKCSLVLFSVIVAATCETTTRLEVPQSNVKLLNHFLTTTTKSEPTTSTCHCAADQWYIIRNPRSGKVLEVDSNDEVTIEDLTGSDSQSWKFESIGQPGVYQIINKKTSDVLDVRRDLNRVITGMKSDSASQKWVVDPSGRLYNKDCNKVLEITDWNYAAGTSLKVGEDKGFAVQEFSLHREGTQNTMNIDDTGSGDETSDEEVLHMEETTQSTTSDGGVDTVNGISDEETVQSERRYRLRSLGRSPPHSIRFG